MALSHRFKETNLRSEYDHIYLVVPILLLPIILLPLLPLYGLFADWNRDFFEETWWILLLNSLFIGSITWLEIKDFYKIRIEGEQVYMRGIFKRRQFSRREITGYFEKIQSYRNPKYVRKRYPTKGVGKGW